MEKLKKLFPLSFKFNKSVGELILCALLYILIEFGVGLLLGWIIQPIVSTIVGALLSPITVIGVFCYLLAFALLYAGIFVCMTGVGAIIGIPMMIISIPMMIIAIPVAGIAGTVTSLVMVVFTSMATIYTMVGCVIAVLAYAGVFGEIAAPATVAAKEIQSAE